MSVAFELRLALLWALFSTKASDSESVVLTVGLTASKIARIIFQKLEHCRDDITMTIIFLTNIFVTNIFIVNIFEKNFSVTNISVTNI